MVVPQVPQAQCEEKPSEQKYKDLYGNPRFDSNWAIISSSVVNGHNKN